MADIAELVERFGDVDVFLGLDHSQLEIRVLAQMSGDKLLIQLIQSGEDIHSAVGHELTGIPIEKIKHDRSIRTAVKGIHFAIIFGKQKEGLYYQLKTEAAERKEEFTMSKEDVAKLYDSYFHRFSGVRDFMDNQIAAAASNEYVETLFGFQREVSQFGSDNRTSYWKNIAQNSPIQGTAHQLILVSFAVLELQKAKYKLWQRLCMEVHDSLICFTKLRDLPATYKQGVQLLEKDVLVYVKLWWPHLNWQVPLKAEGKAGFRLGVMVDGYAGGSVEEFLEKWCQKNRELGKKIKTEIQKAQASKTV